MLTFGEKSSIIFAIVRFLCSNPTHIDIFFLKKGITSRRSLMKRMYKDIFVIGFALFSMFFGAGNVIFPPYLGLSCGSQWFFGFVCYYLADIGLALLALFSILRCGGPEEILRRTGRIPSTLLMGAIVLCIGPMLAIPRTAATTYEMSLAPLVSGFSPVLFSFLFFTLILILCLKESAVVDIVGKVLTPALLIGLLILIIKGVVDPIGSVPDRVLVESVPVTGIEAGYQTMDVLAAMVFGIIVLKSAQKKGYTDGKAQFRVVAGAGLVAGIALMIVYLGLTYLGVTTSKFFDLTVPRTFLVVSIVRNLMGTAGTILFSIVVALACITTAVALVSSAASYFTKLSGDRISYKYLVIGICTFSAVVSTVGLDQIVSLAAPILSIVYPPTLILILLSLADERIKSDLVFQLAALGALAISILSVAADYGLSVAFLQHLPLHALGFGWLVPALLFALAGALISRAKTSKNM
jgi:LIVCS family branched-chain amino acid:cation transporter